MNVKKATEAVPAGAPTSMQLEAINAQAKGKLTQEQIYVFSVRLCDDQIDRDWERFDTQALPQLAKLFLGKTGIVDHRWSTDGQVARIFATEVVEEDRAHYIKAWAYIRRGGQADEVIADIEAGIKKEVSVGCSMGKAVCSICGSPYGSCGHQKGEHYDGAPCCAILQEPMDAYEFSFVAVPAQPMAGVLKGLGSSGRSLKELADAFGAQAEYRALYQDAQLGQCYKRQLQDDVVRLCLSLELGVEEPVLRNITQTVASENLMKLKQALEQRLAQSLPVQTQLGTFFAQSEQLESSYLI